MKLKELREASGITQLKIAQDLNIGRASYNRYELGLTEPSISTLIALADYFHTTIDNLLDHNIPYLLDISTMSNTQKNIINMLKTFDDRQCDKVEAFMIGIQGANDIKQMTINKLKGE